MRASAPQPQPPQKRAGAQLPPHRDPSPASPAQRPVLLSVDHIKRAIGDPNFYAGVPEFLPIRKKMEAMHVDYNTGCSPCKKRRVATSLTSDFVTVLTGLSDDGLARVKKYLGVPKLMVRSVNKQTGKMEMKEV